MKFSLPSSVTSKVAMKSLVLQKHSPQVLFYGGLALMGATVVSACQATLKLEGTLDDIRRDREDLKQVVAVHPDKYSDSDITKLNIYITARGAAKLIKLYLPTAVLSVAAVASLTGSNNILNRRNAGLSAALASTERAMAKYRERVIDTYGEEIDRDMMFGSDTIERKTFNADGSESKRTQKVKVYGEGRSPYARIWGQDTSTEWDPIPEYNLAKLRSIQTYMNNVLQSRGHVFLNDVFDELGLDRTPAGSVVGWLSEKNGGKDGYVDLGVLSQGEEVAFVDFMTGHETHLLLDFNVDGEIFRRI